jgi:hypothetical protein
MDFGSALKVLKAGGTVARVQEWCGGLHDVTVQLVPAQPGHRAYLAIRTGTGELAPWLPQHFDLLAEDWAVVIRP